MLDIIGSSFSVLCSLLDIEQTFKKDLISIIQIGKQGHIRLHKLARKW